MNPNPVFEPGQPAPDMPEHTHPGHAAGPQIDPSLIYTSTAPASPMPDPAPPMQSGLGNAAYDQPVAVVKVLSTRGVEYGMMAIALWVAASTMAWVVLNLLNGSGGFDSVVVPTSSLVICLPVFGLLFLRLKKAELVIPELRLDPSKRRWSQTTQFLAYIVLLVNFIYFVYTIMQHASGGHAPSIGKSLINLVVVTVIAGGVLAYYWHDEHRARRV
jgi:hypothetical protein